MRISELHSMPDEFGKHAKELHTTKQRFMYGSEINSAVIAKAAPKRERMNIADMLKFAVAGVAAAAVITVSAGQTGTEEPPEAFEPDFGKYHYTVTYPTHKETISPGGYALYLDIGTEEKKQAFYNFFADSVYEFLCFFEENGENYLNEADDEERIIWTSHRSATDNFLFCTSGYEYKFDDNDDMYLGGFSFAASAFYDYDRDDFIVRDEVGLNTPHFFSIHFSGELIHKINQYTFSDMIETYGGKSHEEVLEITSGLLDEFLLYGLKDDGVSLQDDLVCYETIHSMRQFTVEQGTAELEMPEFVGVVRDDELYGFKKITVPSDKNYFLITGSDEYPLDKPYGFDLRSFIISDRNDDITVNTFSDYTHMWYSDWEDKISCMSKYEYPLYYDEERGGREYEIYLTDFIRRPRFTELTGTAPVYYGLTTVSVERNTELVVPQLCRPLPIEDTYYTFELPGNDTYTITNNGDHEVVVIGNYGGLSILKRTDGLDQHFDYEPLLPGESLTITSTGVMATLTTLTMPECCTVIDSSGIGYESAGAEADLINRTIKEDQNGKHVWKCG